MYKQSPPPVHKGSGGLSTPSQKNQDFGIWTRGTYGYGHGIFEILGFSTNCRVSEQKPVQFLEYSSYMDRTVDNLLNKHHIWTAWSIFDPVTAPLWTARSSIDPLQLLLWTARSIFDSVTTPTWTVQTIIDPVTAPWRIGQN